MRKSLVCFVVAVAGCGRNVYYPVTVGSSPGAPPGQLTPGDGLPSVALQISAADLARLDANPTSDDKVPGAMSLDGATAAAELRYRGASTRTLPQKSFDVDL